jgi:hypothetical protein
MIEWPLRFAQHVRVILLEKDYNRKLFHSDSLFGRKHSLLESKMSMNWMYTVQALQTKLISDT